MQVVPCNLLACAWHYHCISALRSVVRDHCWPSLLPHRQCVQHNRLLWSFLGKLKPTPTPPSVIAVPRTKHVNKHTWEDSYGWLEEDNQQTYSFIRQEQNYAQAVSQRHKQLSAALQQEFQRCWTDEQDELPERCGNFWYFTRPGSHIPQFVRRDAAGREQRLLDTDLLGQHQGMLTDHFGVHPGTTIVAIKVCIHGELLAYTVPKEDGADSNCAIVQDLKTGAVLPHGMLTDVVSIEFAADGHTLLYTVPDILGRPAKVIRRDLACGRDEVVLEEPDDASFVEVTRSKDGVMLMININSKLTSEVHLLDAWQPWDVPRLVRPREPGVEYFVEHLLGHLVIITTAGPSPGCCLMTAPVERPAEWRLLLPERPGIAIADMDMFDRRCVLYERHAGLPAISILPLGLGSKGELVAGEPQRVPLPDWATTLTPGANQDFHARTLRLSFSSPVHPGVSVDLHMDSGEMQQLVTEQVSGHDPQQYVCTRWHSTSPDGTKVPVTVAHARGLKLDSTAPLLLLAYGAYGQPLEADFDSVRLALLRRGWVVAFAHVRGGGELGRQWHAEGRQLHKRNSLLDYLAVADDLVARGYTRPGRVAALGVSAGGLLAAAVLNERPQLFGAVMLRMPFVDLLSVMTDSSQPLTVHEYDEWGDPADPAALEQMWRLCPYHNLKPGKYPAVLICCSLSDQRVPWWGPAKYAAKLRSCQEAPKPVVLCVEEGGGHADSRLSDLRTLADDYAFLVTHVSND